MEQAELDKAILNTVRRIIERNEGDIEALFTGYFTFDNGSVLLQFTRENSGEITAHYDCYGKTFLSTFKETDL
jgi:hypothetical protein